MPARHLRTLAIAAISVGVPTAAAARVPLAIPAGPLSASLSALARQGRVDIGGIDPALARLTAPALAGTMSVTEALRRLLAETRFEAQPIGPTAWRIVPRAAGPPRAPVAASATPAPAGATEIVVTAGKRPIPLAMYPGSAVVMPIGNDAFGPHGAGNQTYLLRRTPILQSTELGWGRNKFFIRGIADSSFIGPTQATAGTYWAEVRTGYNGPDPNLNLYDVDRVEILEGPQGALYGAGSIGGVIRLAPRQPDLHNNSASAEVGVTSTRHGGEGYDAAAMVNLVPAEGRVAIRAVAFNSRDPGYIDDPGRNARDVNRVVKTGGRATIRIHPADGLTADIGILAQRDRQPDLQYALRDAPPLVRRAAVAQPFSDDYLLGRLVILKQWQSGTRLLWATGRVAHDTDQRYDATRNNFANPIVYDERNSIRLTTSEMRLSHYDTDGDGWLIGAALVADRTTRTRRFGPLSSTRDLVGVVNRTDEKALFGALTQGLSKGLTLTAGARATRARMDGDASATTIASFIRGRTTSRIDPQVGLTYAASNRVVLFAQYQQGFRTGGLAVARGVGRVANYDDDAIHVGELGLRLIRQGPRGLSAVAALSYARWNDIQADMVSVYGFPFTANVGDGRIAGFEGSLDWVPIETVRATANVFLNHSRLVNVAPEFMVSGSRPLPATPSVAATGALAWSLPLGTNALTLEANARYVGHSRLGVGPVLDLPYGNYVETGLSAAYKLRHVEFSLIVDNVLDVRGDRFAIGNPFGVAYRDERTPLRPRTIRLGAKTRF